MRKINEIIVHCSDSVFGDVATIRQWHMQRGFSDIGYHYVIKADGQLEYARPVEKMGAHCKGHNYHSIGICLIGRHEFDEEQFNTLRRTIESLEMVFPGIESVVGHRFYDKNKTCPNFNVQEKCLL